MNRITHRLCVGLVLLGAAGSASAQQVAPANIHFLVDTSGSMRELPQVTNSEHKNFFALTTGGCFNPRLDAVQTARGWHPDTVYSVPDTGTGLGADVGFPNLFQDSKFYGYMYWADSNNPAYQWNTREEACQSRLPSWSTTEAELYSRCVSCLNLKGYWKHPAAVGRDTAPLNSLDFIFWGRFLNFNPPKYVGVRAALKQVIKDLQNARAGVSYFINAAPNTDLLKPQSPTCDQALASTTAFDSYRASYIDSLNGLAFTTGTPLARSLLNIGYYFTSDNSVYQTAFNFGANYAYPVAFKNAALTSQSRSVCWGCQHSAAIIVTDGEPSGDSLASGLVANLRTVNGGPVYCPDTEPCSSGASLALRDKGTNPGTSGTALNDDNPNYYLDDVAKLLFTQDLQRNTPPVVGDFDTSGQQSLTVHTVGYGINSNLLKNTAAVGGGFYYTADNPAALKEALTDIVMAVQTQAESCIYSPP